MDYSEYLKEINNKKLKNLSIKKLYDDENLRKEASFVMSDPPYKQNFLNKFDEWVIPFILPGNKTGKLFISEPQFKYFLDASTEWNKHDMFIIKNIQYHQIVNGYKKYSFTVSRIIADDVRLNIKKLDISI